MPGEDTPEARPSSSDSDGDRAPAIADVVVPRHLHRVFSYRIPPQLTDRVKVGTCVRVPFGRSILPGLVVGCSHAIQSARASLSTSVSYQLRDIAAVAEDQEGSHLLPDLLALTRLISDYYIAPLGQCLHLVLPPERPRHTAHRYVASPRSGLPGPLPRGRSLPPGAVILLEHLKKRPSGSSAASLRRLVGPSFKTDIAALKRRRLIDVLSSEHPTGVITRKGRPALDGQSAGNPAEAAPCGTSRVADSSLVDQLRHAISAERPTRFLLRMSSEARLPILIELAGHARREHRGALMIVGEIGRAERLSAVLASRGHAVALLHSDLDQATRLDAWRRARMGIAPIVVGTRSAVFAPIRNLGVVVIEEEHSSSLKEESEPRYHARTVAWMRAKLAHAVLVLGSAHPSLETIRSLSAASDQDRMIELRGKADPTDRPTIDVIDARHLAFGSFLSEAILARLAAGRGQGLSVLLLDRKGFASALRCQDCGQVPQCPRCSVSLTFYKRAGRLGCRYCGVSLPLPDVCSTCQAARLAPLGVGTEAVEEYVRRAFPNLRVARVDADTASARFMTAVRRALDAGEIDLLVGTQMLLHEDAIPRAAFVGIVDADAGLHLPDFRASEQSYHTLMEMVGMAKPMPKGGAVIIQTRLPTHHVIQAVAQDNPALFYEHEAAFRRVLEYPPFGDLFTIHASSPSPSRGRDAAEHLATDLRARGTDRDVTVLGPVQAPLGHLRGKHRWQIAVKTTDGHAGRQIIREALITHEEQYPRRQVKLDVDVEPLSML